MRAGLADALGEHEVAMTSGPGEATELTRKALRAGFSMIVAVGGDGTVNEVVNGFYDGDEPVRESPILGLLPSGTGGDYRKTWGLSKDPEEAVRRLKEGEIRAVDMGRVRYTGFDGKPATHYFANVASFGLSGRVCQRVNRSRKLLGGKVSFFLASAGALMSYRRQPVTLTIAGEAHELAELTVGACCVGRYFGGGMMIGPQADPSDGLLDVVTLDRVGRWDMMRMTSIYTGEHLSNPKVSHWRDATIGAVANGDHECLIEADGEVIGMLPATFEIVPKAFRIKV